MRWDLRKGAISHCGQKFVLIAHNFKAVLATGLKPGMVILQSLLYDSSCPGHFWYGHGDREYRTRSKITSFLGLTLELHHLK